MSFKISIILLLILVNALLTSTLPAQPGWEVAGITFLTPQVHDIFVDTIGNALYFSGNSSVNNDNDYSDVAVSVYANIQWDTLYPFLGETRATIRWNDTIIVGGSFVSVNGLPYSKIAAWDSTGWIPYGDIDDQVRGFTIIDNELYAYGGFQNADGQPCPGIAKRVGNLWEPVGQIDASNPTLITDLVKFQGNLYASGVIRFNAFTEKDVAVLNGNQWEPLGTGLLGGFSTGKSLAVYQNELYIGGSIDINAGNAGHGIMRWSGVQGEPFQSVGTGLQLFNNNYTGSAEAHQMIVHADKLFVCGQFFWAGHVPAPHVAFWDGVDWCGVAGDLDGPVRSIAFFHDTLYAAPFYIAEGQVVNSAARYIAPDLADTCTMLTNIEEVLNGGFEMFPNPSSGQVHLSFNSRFYGSAMKLLDATGRIVHSERIKGQERTLNLEGRSKGIYLLTISGKDGQRFTKRLMLE